jgi:hypothetical protein
MSDRMGAIDIVIRYDNDDRTYRSALASIQRLSQLGAQHSRAMNIGFNNVTRSVNNMGSDVKKTTKHVEGLSHAVKGLASMWVVAKGLDLAKILMNAGMAAQKADQLMNNTFKKSAPALDSWAKKYQDAFHLNPSELKTSVSVLGNIFTNAGVKSDMAMELGKSLTLLSNDLALAFGQKTADALVDIRSAMVGQTEGIQKYGVQVEESYVQQVLLSKGITVTMQKMSGAEKIYARYLAIMVQTNNQQGFYAQALDKSFGKMQAIKSSWQTLTGAMGAMFEPVLDKVLGKVLQIMLFANAVAKRVAEALNIKMPDGPVPQDIKASSDALGDQSSELDKLAEAAKNAKDNIGGFDRLNLMDKPTTSANPTGTGELDAWINGTKPLPKVDWAGYIKNLQDSLNKYDVQSVADKIIAIKDSFSTIWGITKAIGVTMLAWKISKSMLAGFTVMQGVASSIAGVASGKRTPAPATAVPLFGGGIGGSGGATGGRNRRGGSLPFIVADAPNILNRNGRTPHWAVGGTPLPAANRGNFGGTRTRIVGGLPGRTVVPTNPQVAGALATINAGANAGKLAALGKGALNLAKFAAVPAILTTMVMRFTDLTAHSSEFNKGLGAIGSTASKVGSWFAGLIVGKENIDKLSGKTKTLGLDIKDAGIAAVAGTMMLIPGLQPFGIALGVFEATTIAIRAIGKASEDAVMPINVLGDGISENTKKKLQPFLDAMRGLDDDMTKLNWTQKIITAEDVTAIDGRVKSVVSMINTELAADKIQATDLLSPLKKSMSKEEFDKLTSDAKTYFDDAQKKMDQHGKDISAIYRTAANEHRTLKKGELEDINAILDTMNRGMLKAASDNEVEYMSIYRNMKENVGRVNLEQATDTIQTGNKIRDKTITTAENTYSKTLLLAAEMYGENGKLNKEAFNNVVNGALAQKNEEVRLAKEKHAALLEATKKGLGDQAVLMDLETGKQISKVKAAWNELWRPRSSEEWKQTYEDMYSGEDHAVRLPGGDNTGVWTQSRTYPAKKTDTYTTPFTFAPAPKKRIPNAKGGVYTRPTALDVVENGIPEAVVPIGNSRFVDAFAAKVGGVIASLMGDNNGGPAINFNGPIYGGNRRQVARELVDAMEAEGLRVGR